MTKLRLSRRSFLAGTFGALATACTGSKNNGIDELSWRIRELELQPHIEVQRAIGNWVHVPDEHLVLLLQFFALANQNEPPWWGKPAYATWLEDRPEFAPISVDGQIGILSEQQYRFLKVRNNKEIVVVFPSAEGAIPRAELNDLFGNAETLLPKIDAYFGRYYTDDSLHFHLMSRGRASFVLSSNVFLVPEHRHAFFLAHELVHTYNWYFDDMPLFIQEGSASFVAWVLIREIEQVRVDLASVPLTEKVHSLILNGPPSATRSKVVANGLLFFTDVATEIGDDDRAIAAIYDGYTRTPSGISSMLDALRHAATSREAMEAIFRRWIEGYPG